MTDTTSPPETKPAPDMPSPPVVTSWWKNIELRGFSTIFFGFAVLGGFFVALAFIAYMAYQNKSCTEAMAIISMNAEIAAAKNLSTAAEVATTIADSVQKMRCSEAAWSELFKTGFILLGGAVTSVIGYFFGSRGVEGAERRAIDAKTDAERDIDKHSQELLERAERAKLEMDQILLKATEDIRARSAEISSTGEEAVEGMEDPD